MTTLLAPNLYTWTITLDTGEQRTSVASELGSVIGDLPVVSAVRGAAFTTEGPPPVASTLVPATAVHGAASFTLQVTGTAFRDGCQIVWNGVARPTTVVSATALTTTVDLSSVAAAVNIPVLVRDVLGRESNVLTFAVT